MPGAPSIDVPPPSRSTPSPPKWTGQGQRLSRFGSLASPAAMDANDFVEFWLDNLIICSAFILSKVDDK
jgi:hypothetical protein